MNVERRVLEGHAIRLLPLTRDHAESVTRVALAHPQIWTHIPYPMQSEGDVHVRLEQAAALHAAGLGVVFVTELRQAGEIVGGTSILSVDPRVPSFEIGGTWIVPPHQRTRVNTEAKYLQLCFAFETLGAARVELKTDVRNERSRKAIARIGGRFEGIFRNHMRRADGSLRDSAFFSIVSAEWPEVKRTLEERLSQAAERNGASCERGAGAG